MNNAGAIKISDANTSARGRCIGITQVLVVDVLGYFKILGILTDNI